MNDVAGEVGGVSGRGGVTAATFPLKQLLAEGYGSSFLPSFLWSRPSLQEAELRLAVTVGEGIGEGSGGGEGLGGQLR